MTEEDSGWSASLFTVDGPNAYDTVRTYRLNQLNQDQQIILLGNGDDGTQATPFSAVLAKHAR